MQQTYIGIQGQIKNWKYWFIFVTLQSCWAYIGWSSLSIVFADASLYTTLKSLYTTLGWSGFHCMPPTHNNAGMGAHNRMPGDSVHNYQAADFVPGFRWSLLVLRHSIRAPLMAHLTTKRKIVSCKHPEAPNLPTLLFSRLWGKCCESVSMALHMYAQNLTTKIAWYLIITMYVDILCNRLMRVEGGDDAPPPNRHLGLQQEWGGRVRVAAPAIILSSHTLAFIN